MTFFVTVLVNIFMRPTLTHDFWGLHKNTNCAFPLKEIDIQYNISTMEVTLIYQLVK